MPAGIGDGAGAGARLTTSLASMSRIRRTVVSVCACAALLASTLSVSSSTHSTCATSLPHEYHLSVIFPIPPRTFAAHGPAWAWEAGRGAPN